MKIYVSCNSCKVNKSQGHVMYSIIIAKSLTRRLERNGPISDKQALHPWLTFHFDAVRLAVAVRNESAGGRNCIQNTSIICQFSFVHGSEFYSEHKKSNIITTRSVFSIAQYSKMPFLLYRTCCFFNFSTSKALDTLRRVLTKSIFCYGDSSQA
ncbi:hypothetical protein T4A_13621, partial [Trichinella pseudospiralis]